MDEKRRQAYLNLINQLLNCPSGEKAEILKTNLELVDAGLVQIMLQVADNLAEQEDENNATWLRNWASHLGEMIANCSAVTSLEMYLDFLMEVLLATSNSDGEPQQVYQLLRDNLNKLDDNFAYVLRDWATERLSEVKPEQAQELAGIIGDLSCMIWQFPWGSKASNSEIAIAGCEIILTVFTSDSFPCEWARTQNTLGNAYLYRIKSNKSENIEKAIAAYTAALSVRTCTEFPLDWARTKNNLGTAYFRRIRDNKAENIEKAIASYTSVTSIISKTESPADWAMTQHNLGNVYLYRIKGDKAENIEKAITAYTAALEVYTHTDFPQDWAMTQHNLGNGYRYRIKGDRAENIEKAITAYTAALSLRTPTDVPQQWAGTKNQLGNAYRHRIKDDKAENIEKAIAAYTAALEVYSRTDSPQDWATTKNNLGNAYSNRINSDKEENIENAIAAYIAALEVYSRTDFPQDWAMTQNNLGTAYSKRIKGDKRENVENAIASYTAVLEVYTHTDFPQDWTMTQYNLGLLYQDVKQFKNAYTAFQAAIDTVESLREEIVSGDESKQKLAEEWHKIYERMVEVCLDMGNYTAAIEYAERSKNRNLVELILIRDSSTFFPAYVVIQLAELRDEIASGQNLIQTGKSEKPQDLAAQMKQWRQQRNELQDRYLSIGHSFKLSEFQKKSLHEDIAVIEWYIIDTNLEIFIITRHRLERVKISNSNNNLDALVTWADTYINDYYEPTDNWMTQLTPRLKELAKILHLDEILSHLPKDCQQLILIPHRYLHLFPLHALPVGELCLLDIFPKGVSYAPSCQLLLQAQKRQRPDFTHLFAVQNPTKDRPYVDFGVEAIRPYFQPNDYVLPGDKAIKANLIQSEQLRSAHCFHFFGHATFNFEKSALILADGHLTLGEIFALDLNQCRLVILSACETGMTDFNSISDEYIGLPSGFLFAGSPSVVSTLWEVDQLSAAFLMIEFYENLRKYKQLEEGDIAIALNLAQKRLRDLTVDEFKKRLIKYKALIDEILSKLPKVERRKAEASITYRLSQAYPFAHPSDWAAFTATGI
jgi:CHAT domain-containing protein